MSGDDATYYSDRIGQSGVFVSVDADGTDRQVAQVILRDAGGHSSTQGRVDATTY